ncbi:4-oxalocrotonate tautomerase [Paenibacillus sp. KN14-4R]|uniref:4-oxalocrotonate tautomerase n=1 Tax=Paenibacillus sp. KN14-4R TaxID=3445773 RepID=UPI003FA05C09
MPIVQISILEGREKHQVAGLIAEVTDAVVNSLLVKKEQVRVLVTEIPASHWGAGGVTKDQ